MLREFFYSPSAWRRVFAWIGAAVIVASAVGVSLVLAWLNTWYGQFYALAQDAAKEAVEEATSMNATAAEVAHEAGVRKVWDYLFNALYVLGPLAMLEPAASFVQQHYALTWRMCLVEAYLERWHAADASQDSIEGASQRIHEDTQRFARSLETGIMKTLQSSLTLIVFTPTLISLGETVHPPAYLAALVYRTTPAAAPAAWLMHVCVTVTLIGFGVAILVTRHLVALEVGNQKVEAALRKQLVLAENMPGYVPPPIRPGGLLGALIAPTNGERRDGDGAAARARDPTVYIPLLSSLQHNYGKLYANFLGFNLWVGGWSQSIILLPFFLAGPRLFDLHDPIDIGVLVQVSDAFQRVFESLSVGMRNWAAVRPLAGPSRARVESTGGMRPHRRSALSSGQRLSLGGHPSARVRGPPAAGRPA